MHHSQALKTYVGMRACFAFIFALIVTVNLVYQVSIIGLNPLQLVLVGTVLEVVTFLGEVPTGIVADLYSRKLSVVIGHFLMGCGFILEGSSMTFAVLLLAQGVWGFGYTFISGAREAWIADEIGEEYAGRAFMRGQQAAQIGTFGGIALSTILVNINIRLPIILGGVFFCILSLVLMVTMHEEHFSPLAAESRHTFQSMKNTFTLGLHLIDKRRILIIILITGALFGLFSEGVDRLWTPFMLRNFTFPVFWIGIIGMVAAFLTLIVTEILKRTTDLLDHTSTVKSLFVCHGMLILGAVVFGLAGGFTLAMCAYWFITTFKEARMPLNEAWTNQYLEPQVRATMFSMGSQANALGQIVGGPIIGIVANEASIRSGFYVAALALIPTLFLYKHTLGKHKFVGNS